MKFLKSSFLLFSPWGGLPGKNNAVLNDLKLNVFDGKQKSSSTAATAAQSTIESFIASLNKNKGSNGSTEKMIEKYFDENVAFTDGSFYNSIVGKDDLLRHFLLFQDNDSSALSIHSNRYIVIDDIAAALDASLENDNGDDGAAGGDTGKYNVCVQYHLEELMVEDGNASVIPDSKGITFYTMHDDKIIEMFDVLEPPSPKPGNAGLELLEKASSILGKNDSKEENVKSTNALSPNANVVEKYFDAWNQRKMDYAVNCFSDDCLYEDLQYSTPFSGKDNMKRHLFNVAKCLPESFQFKVDKLVVMSNKNPLAFEYKEKVGVQWHVESDDDELPFTKGCSFYVTNRNDLIKSGVDIPEPAVIKKGAFNSVAKRFIEEPVRFIPASVWMAYMYIVFFSDGILPGANALALEQRTWEEVRDLSLNFFLVSPMLNLPFAPVVHPMLEGVFNLLLAWAAMFAGFLSDERKDKPNVLPFGPIIVGMQFLTSAFLLPYLALRTSENDEVLRKTVFKEDIDGEIQAKVGEWRPLGPLLGGVGTSSIVWAFLARPEFGNLSERYHSLLELLSVDRVGSSFLVDLAIFALFQGWFVDDDMKRRGIAANEEIILRNVAKFVPFFGLAFFLSVRPELSSKEES